MPFVMAILLFLVSYCGVAVSVYPFIVPRAVTVWQAAAPDESLAFLLVGTAILLPIILAYTGYSYWVFRGKVDLSARLPLSPSTGRAAITRIDHANVRDRPSHLLPKPRLIGQLHRMAVGTPPRLCGGDRGLLTSNR